MTIQTPIPIQRVEGQTFVGANIQTDGFVMYVKCTFERCMMMYTGGTYMVQPDCTTSNCNWQFSGFAGNLIGVLRTLFGRGGKDREMVEAFITQIRTAAPQLVKKEPPKNDPPNTVQ
jgi:hypothetical protein